MTKMSVAGQISISGKIKSKKVKLVFLVVDADVIPEYQKKNICVNTEGTDNNKTNKLN